MPGNDRLPESGESWTEDIERINAVHHWLVRESQRGGLRSIAHFIVHQENELANERIARQDTEEFAEAVLNDAIHISRGVLHKREEIYQLREETKYATKTGLLTREAFEAEAIARTTPIKRVSQLSKVHSLIFADLDDFKQLNETLGHIRVDDEILKPVGDILFESIRFPEDLASQFGGEEFVILLTETTVEGAMEVAHRIRKQINDKKVGISMGMVSYDQGDDFYRALEISNRAMRQAKKLPGKNQNIVLKMDTELD